MAAVVFLVCLVVLSLFAWERLKQPSPQFHFVDLAHSFWAGRFDTDTPRTNARAKTQEPNASPGFYDAVIRQTTRPNGEPRGWNDWSSYRVITLKSGDVLKGVFPWRNEKKSERKNEFHALDGNTYQVDCRRDVKSGCYGNKPEHLRFHVSFPPAPGVLMMPLTKVWGYNVNDVLFTLFFAALNGLLMFLLLESLVDSGHSQRTRADNLWITALFAFGTVSFFSSVRGEVWFTALVVGMTFNILALRFMVDLKRPLLAGVCVALGMATRIPLVFSCVLVALIALFPNGRLRTSDFKRTLGQLVVFALPVAVMLGLLMFYNHARFENMLEFGHTYLQEGQRNSIRRHGLMSSWFLGPNLSAAFINPPVITFEGGPIIRITKHGLGMIWTTPVLFLLAIAPKRTGLFKALLATALVVALPGLFYQNTGWEQFGYRFSLDWLPYLIAAFAIGGVALNRWVKGLIILGIVVNAFGALTFGRAYGIYY